MIKISDVDHQFSFSYSFLPNLSETNVNEKQRKPCYLNHHFKWHENISRKDLNSVAVSGDWILSKHGIYGNGRQKRSELISDAAHSPMFKHLLKKLQCNNSSGNQK
jgi:hypothetical protein